MKFDTVDALLLRVLPPGDHGASIVGDLRQEWEYRRRTRLRSPTLWYWASAISLILRYAPSAVGRWWRSREGLVHRGGEWMGSLLMDARFGLRVLVKTPMLSLVAIATIALGVGITTHTFSVIYGSILRGLPVPDAHELMDVYQNIPSRNIVQDELTYPDFAAVRDEVTAFTDVAAHEGGYVNMAGDEGPPEQFFGGHVTWNMFDLVGVPPLMGRVFAESDDRLGAPLTIVLSHNVWTNRFAGDPDIVGKTIRANAEPATVIGVMPEGYHFPFAEEVWLPVRFDPSTPRSSSQDMRVVGRLRAGATTEAAQRELSAVGERIGREFPETNADVSFALQPFEDSLMPAEIKAMLWAMFAAVMGVLLIACVNVANLMLARATLRTNEMAVRTAMGASRWRVVRQLLIEAGLLAAAGSVVGLGLAFAGIDLFNRAIVDIQKPFWVDIRVDLPTLAFTLAATAVVALLAGIVPARRASRVSVGEVLKDESRGSSSRRLGRFSTGLVMAELAVSCALLVGAGLMVKSIVNLKSRDLGFETAQVMTGRVGLPPVDYPEQDDRTQFFARLESALAAVPGVEAAAISSSLPGAGTGRWAFGIEGQTYLEDADYHQTWGNAVSHDFFRVMGATIRQGRDFVPGDNTDEADPVVVINQSFAERYFPDQEPIGQTLKVGRSSSTLPWMRVVGVVDDLNIGGNIGGIGNDRLSPEQIFIPSRILNLSYVHLALKTQGAPSQLSGPMRDVVASLDPNLPVFEVRTMDQVIQENSWAFGLFGSLFALFGVIALFLSAVGLYGVMAFSVSQRRQELGIRIALGAGPGDVIRLVMQRGVGQLAVGLGLGLGLGWLLARPLASVLYGVDPLDVTVYASIAVALIGTGLLATFLPAKTATRADPARAMR